MEITVLIFNLNFCPFVHPQNSILTSTIILTYTEMGTEYLLTSQPTLLPTSFWAFQGQRSHTTAQNFRWGPEVGWEQHMVFPSHPNLTYPRSFLKCFILLLPLYVILRLTESWRESSFKWRRLQPQRGTAQITLFTDEVSQHVKEVTRKVL